MDIEQIKQRLLGCGYVDNEVTAETAKRLLSLTGKSAEMLKEWMTNATTPSFAPINGVGSDFLTRKLKMKEPALIIAHAMLEADSVENANYFKHLSDNIVGFYPTRTK